MIALLRSSFERTEHSCLGHCSPELKLPSRLSQQRLSITLQLPSFKIQEPESVEHCLPKIKLPPLLLQTSSISLLHAPVLLQHAPHPSGGPKILELALKAKHSHSSALPFLFKSVRAPKRISSKSLTWLFPQKVGLTPSKRLRNALKSSKSISPSRSKSNASRH